MPTIKKKQKNITGELCHSGPPREQITEWNSQDRNAPIRAVVKTTNDSRASCFITSRMTSRPHRLKKTSSMQSNRRDLYHTWQHRETNDFYCYSLRWITTTFFTRDCSNTNFLRKHFFCKNPVKVSVTRAFNLHVIFYRAINISPFYPLCNLYLSSFTY